MACPLACPSSPLARSCCTLHCIFVNLQHPLLPLLSSLCPCATARLGDCNLQDCGQPAAEYFCQRHGWARAAGFGGPVGQQCPADHPDCVATVVLKTREPCTPGQWPCSAFEYIECADRVHT